MSRVRGLELLFNLEKSNIQSKEDCIVAVLHCVLLNEKFKCFGSGDEWPEDGLVATELLPKDWNSNQNTYSLRYRCPDEQSRILLKATKMEHILQIDAVMNEDVAASLPIPIDKCISDDYKEYSTAFKDLEFIVESFHKNIIDNLNKPKEKKKEKSSSSPPRGSPVPPSAPQPSRSPFGIEDPTDPFQPRIPRHDGSDFDPLRRPRFPRVGGSDLDPFAGPGGGGMFMDPSSFGIPARPTLPQFGVGGPGGLPRGAVPPGARFDPFMPPIAQDRRRHPHPDLHPPPDFDDYYM